MILSGGISDFLEIKEFTRSNQGELKNQNQIVISKQNLFESSICRDVLSTLRSLITGGSNKDEGGKVGNPNKILKLVG